MISIVQKLIPAVIALIFGSAFIIGRNRIEQKIIDSHEKFWKQTFNLHGKIGGFGEFFMKGMILALGISFLLIGLFLIYKFISKRVGVESFILTNDSYA